MTFGDKLAQLRREQNYTQEQLADILGVTRQSVSKWESGLSYPETEKLIKICELFDCSLDYFLKNGEHTKENVPQENVKDSAEITFSFPKLKERKSNKTLWGLPLWHIAKNAKGIIAIGVKANGIISVGVVAKGVVSVGVISLGAICCGTLAFGLLFAVGVLSLAMFSVGCFAIGIYAIGAISLGAFSLGAIAIGDVSVGALAIGNHFALGDQATAAIAIGAHEANGTVFEHLGKLDDATKKQVLQLIEETFPTWLNWTKGILQSLLS